MNGKTLSLPTPQVGAVALYKEPWLTDKYCIISPYMRSKVKNHIMQSVFSHTVVLYVGFKHLFKTFSN